jgi:hypothetical protein
MLGSHIPHCIDSRLTDGGKVVSLAHRARSTPQKHYFSASGTHFSSRARKHRGLVRPEGLGKLKKFIHPTGSRTGVLTTCSLPSALTTTLQRAPVVLRVIAAEAVRELTWSRAKHGRLPI